MGVVGGPLCWCGAGGVERGDEVVDGGARGRRQTRQWETGGLESVVVPEMAAAAAAAAPPVPTLVHL